MNRCKHCQSFTRKCWQHKDGTWATYGDFGPGFGVKGKCGRFDMRVYEEEEACADFNSSSRAEQIPLWEEAS